MTSPGRSGRLRWVSRGLPWALLALIVLGIPMLVIAALIKLKGGPGKGFSDTAVASGNCRQFHGGAS